VKRRISPFRLGLFVVVSVLIVLGGMLWVGSVKLFQNTDTYATVFDFSIQGLQEGAPVKYLGVGVGQVSSISVGRDDRFIVVVFDVDKGFRITDDTVAVLDSAGIAGQTFLSLERRPGEHVAKPSLPFSVRYPLIPARAGGGMAGLERQAKRIMQQINQADIPGLVRAWRQAARQVGGAVEAGDIRQTLDNIRSAAADLQTILHGLRGPAEPPQWRRVFRDISATADALRKSTEDLSRQMNALPPGALASLDNQVKGMVTAGEKTIGSLNRQTNEVVGTLQQSVLEVNRLLAEMQRLVRSLQQSPGRILEQRRGVEPFRR
jgi:ABC-type transporter Mla subunit MlaD